MKNILISFIIAFCIGLFACSEPIDIELDNDHSGELVVEGSITNEHKIHTITLSRVEDYFVNRPTVRELDAEVSITDGDTIINFYDLDNDGIYETDKELAGKVGHTYTLNIALDSLTSSGKQYSATETLNPVAALDSLSISYEKSQFPFDLNEYYYHLNIYTQEPVGKGNYYLWEYYFDDEHITDTIRNKELQPDDLVDGNYLEGWTVYYIPEKEIKKEEIMVRFQMLSISEDLYNFYLGVLLETDYAGGSFSGPPANVPSNISNGGRGFFSASAVSEKSALLKRVRDATNLEP